MSPFSPRRHAWHRPLSVRIAPALALVVAAMPRLAGAQDAAALASRRELIAQAQQARNAGNHQQALDLAERARRIQPSPSLRLFVAQEQNALGRLAEAYGNSDLCMREAEGDTSLRNREQVASTCRALAADLRGRIGRVVVQVIAPAPSGLEVRVAGSPVAETLWGVPYVVTPGAVSIDATASGFRPFHTEVSVEMGASTDVRVVLEPAPETASILRGSSSGPVAGGTTPSSSGVPVAPIVVMGVGVVGLVLAPVFYVVMRNPAAARAQTFCPNFECPDAAARTSAQPHWDAANTWTTLSIVAGSVGVAAVAGGLTWFLLARSHGSPPAHAFHAVPVPGGAMVGLHGTF